MSKKSKAKRRRERAERFKNAHIQELKKASEKKEEKKSGTVTLKPKFRPPCHKVTEIYPNFYLCNINQVKEMVREHEIDILVPLDHVDGYIWDLFEGEIHYWPIEDMSSLPSHILKRAVNDIIYCIRRGKKVGMFCLGGHGRTGYLAACVLGKLGVEDPVQHIHNKYCINAIETYGQYKSIANFLDNPDLLNHYTPTEYDIFGYGYGYGWNYPSSKWGNDTWGLSSFFNTPVHSGVKTDSEFKYIDSMIDEDELDEDNIDVNQFLLQKGVM